MKKKDLIEGLITILYSVNETYEDNDSNSIKLKACTRNGRFIVKVERNVDDKV